MKQEGYRLDWRIALGSVMSAVWLALGIIYIQSNYGWAGIAHLPIGEMGEFLGGAFGPLAFLWLVMGFFIQQSEINQNSRGIEIQVQHMNLDNFLKLSSIIERQMGVTLGLLYISSQGMASDAGAIDSMWTRISDGDVGVFARSFLMMRIDENGNPKDIRDLFFATEIRRRHTANFLRTFESLLEEARECDPKGSIREAMLQGTAFGLLHQYIRSLTPPNP